MLTRWKNETMTALVNHAAGMSNVRNAADLLFENNVPFHVALRVLVLKENRNEQRTNP